MSSMTFSDMSQLYSTPDFHRGPWPIDLNSRTSAAIAESVLWAPSLSLLPRLNWRPQCRRLVPPWTQQRNHDLHCLQENRMTFHSSVTRPPGLSHRRGIKLHETGLPLAHRACKWVPIDLGKAFTHPKLSSVSF